MYLSKLELQGFKSFADRTVLQFDPGITAIVGPNGCGKSNIVDAVRWVIGEQRARILRSEKMENVIFNGTASRKPLGMSEVLLTIENNRGILPTEYTDVEVGRRLFRSGDSEYLMNGVQCRLKDITDLFMDTGMGAGAYSVIELKMVDDILSDNADDRRRLFEEAAGITKYKLRRRQTLSKLDNTQADLTRIRDLTEEVGKQVRTLKRQAKKAERHRQASERLHLLELALARVEFVRLNERRAKLDEELEDLKRESKQSSELEAERERALQEVRSEMQRREERLVGRRAELSTHVQKVRELETERRLCEERLAASSSELERARSEQEASEVRRVDLEAEIAHLKSSLDEAEPRLRSAVDRLEEARTERDARRAASEQKQHALQELRRAARESEEHRSEQRRRLDRHLNRRELLEEEIEKTTSRAENVGESLSDLRAHVSGAREAQLRAKEEVERSQSALEDAERNRAAGQEEVDDALERTQRLKRRRDALAAEVNLLESMLTSYEDFSGAVQFLAAESEFAGDLTTVADVLACNDAERAALSAALGTLARCVVVDSSDEARRAVDTLRQKEEGRATFIVLDRLQAPVPVADLDGNAVPLRQLVRTASQKYDRLADALLYDTFVLDTLEQAEAAGDRAPVGRRFIARTGEWVDARGMIHGGSRGEGASASSARLGRREQLEVARRQREAVDRELDEAAVDLESRRDELAAIPYAERREQLAAAERALNQSDRDVSRIRFELESSESRRDELLEKIEGARAALHETSREVERLETAVGAADADLEARRSRQADAEADFEAAEADRRSASAAFSDASIAAVEARNSRDNVQRDLERANGHVREIRQRAKERALHIRELESTIQETEKQLEEIAAAWDRIEGRQEDLEDAVHRAETRVRDVRQEIEGVEDEVRNLRRRREHLMREENQRAVRRAEVQTRAGDLEEHVAEEFSLSLPEAVSNGSIHVPKDFDEASARSEVRELRGSIRSLGGVNELALESYEKEKERLDFLAQQQEDLEQAEDKLLETIDEINTTASEQFMETYDAIRTNFARIFNDLFGADTAADLELEDPDDPLESAIEIIARPRGKRPSTIAQLSGGEKTLTAIALLFGIYLVKPSPFCILDEVDAPLDDANVERYMRLIRQFSDSTQFILVTHNKLTMEAADRLYGITMQEQGVSRLVGVRFDEALEIAQHPAPREAA